MVAAGDRIGIAVSGGADSVALLRVLLELRGELGVVLSVVHLNHRLRGAEADADAAFVAELAATHGVELHATSQDAAVIARAQELSLEAAGRQLRYQFFARLQEGKVDRVATGHTADDQAETVLLRLIRGAGTRGLAGIHATRTSQHLQGGRGEGRKQIIRPLLGVRRAAIEAYLRSIGQPWREDATNRDPKFLRNRVRHELMPLLERDFNPAAVRALCDTAEIAAAEEVFWEEQIGALVSKETETQPAASLPVNLLRAQPVAMQRRLVRRLADAARLALDFQHVEAVREFATAKGKAELAVLPRGWRAVIEGGQLRFVAPQAKGESSG